ncbi:hypothetical protein L1987_00358 [Smallanthus sonchifolius]|uniref:Uncharacterized protein n=1 Tax=Smallanthus sonchifolius TaxID=185202 RepID=A0ACB9K247_9ASTR|nr:hypothetical protein L1987_00358 [Smallanthus sonchifolius]
MNRTLYFPPESSEESLDFAFGGDSMQFLCDIAAQAEEEDTATSSRTYVQRNREHALEILKRDYFDENPTHGEATFRDRFRMSKRLFLKIVGDVEARFEYFQEGEDARNKKGFTPLQKCISAIKQLGTGNPPDEFDDYLSMARRTSSECLEYFCNAIIQIYGKEFLRRPTSHDITLLYNAHEVKHGIPGMVGSIDCTHFVWRNCPTSLRGQYMRGDHQYPTIMLEAVASNDLWFWHAFCGSPCSNNDINVLQQSSLFTNEEHGTAPNCPFVVNGRLYKRGYYLTDGIYPTWSTFVKSFPYPTIPKEKTFKKVQESARKDAERAFGVLKGKWGILRRPNRHLKLPKIRNEVYTCMILHNMILKDDGNAISPVYIRDPPVEPVIDDNVLSELHDVATHISLRFDLVEHIARNTPDLDEDEE